MRFVLFLLNCQLSNRKYAFEDNDPYLSLEQQFLLPDVWMDGHNPMDRLRKAMTGIAHFNTIVRNCTSTVKTEY